MILRMGVEVEEAAQALPPGALVAERYRVEAILGQGGMGAVYRVLDQRGDRTLALKQLRTGAQTGATAALMASQFEREYHTLCQLAHPSIIEVYDYGIDGPTAFYTMELLDGQDLRERGQLPWRDACAVLRDVASSLAIMHSRRLLHRDISARNVRCTTSGKAKLIDFGAMAPMGLVKHVVGTAPFVPPEAMQMQMLDGRSDLYALGALAYWVLTGRYAYPARALADLSNLWRNVPANPRRYDPQVPEALDQLVMELIELDRNARPVSAAEVMERLSGIAGLELRELPEVSRAYLVAPTLIAREAQLQAVRTRLVSAMQGKGGSSCLIEGAEGTGRSRLLDACVLEARLLGAAVLRADASDADGGEYAVARALCVRLFEDLPRVATKCAQPWRSLLGRLLPDLLPATKADDVSVASLPPSLTALPAEMMVGAGHSMMPGALHPSNPAAEAAAAAAALEPGSMQAALRDFVLSVARSKHVVIAVDDFDTIDAPSAALLGALANGAKRRRLTVLASVKSGADPSPALTLLREIAHPLLLQPFNLQQSESLLRAMFGDAGRLATLNERLFALAGGNPRWTMALCERLVEQGLARYEAGSWRLPIEIGADALPDSLAAASASQLSALPGDARALCEGLALCEVSQLPVDRYRLLTDAGDAGRTYAALQALVTAGILLPQGDRYRFAHHGLPAAVRSGIDPARASELHARLARAHEHGDDPWRVPYHLLMAGREDEGIRHMSVLRNDARALTSRVLSETLMLAVVAAERLGLSQLRQLDLQRGLIGISVARADHARFMQFAWPLYERLARDAGLSDYYELDASLDEDARLDEAQSRAIQRHHLTPDRERGYEPVEAARMLREVIWFFVGMASTAQDLELVERLPGLAPLFPIEPALRVTQLQVEYQRHFQAGRPRLAEATSLELLALAKQPDEAGLERGLATSLRQWESHNQGLFAASRGDRSALTWIAEVENVPFIRANARRVQMAYELMHGNVDAANSLRHRAELFALEDGMATILPGTSTRVELIVYSYTDDVIGVKRTMERLEVMARRFPKWQPTFQLARSQYLRISGDHAGALAALGAALAATAPGRHIDWGFAATMHVLLLHTQARSPEAVEQGLAYIAQCQREDLRATRLGLLRVVAEALTQVGRLSEARTMIEEHLELLQAERTSGLLLGLAYETRARIAIAENDEAAIRHYAQLCAQEYKGARNPALNTKYKGLMREAEAAGVVVTTGLQRAIGTTGDFVVGEISRATQMADHTLSSRLIGCADRAQRAREALRLLLENASAAGGFLFEQEAGRLALLAMVEEDAPGPDFLKALESCIPSSSAGDADDAATSFVVHDDELQIPSLMHNGRMYEPLLLAREPPLLAVLRYATPDRTVVRRELLDAMAGALADDDY
jgi:serine/threonine-protein kinase